MTQELIILLLSAFSIGFLHTLLGPDHYVPFIMMSRAHKWSLPKTMIITTICGVGHVLSALVLGLIAISIGITLTKLNIIESSRGSIAAWLLIVFGLGYFIWGVRSAVRNIKHRHLHIHADGDVHSHVHSHFDQHSHVHTHVLGKRKAETLTPWILFIIFILGPCEPLIPLIMYPGIKGSAWNVLMVTMFFGLATLTTMLGMVFVSVFGATLLRAPIFEKYGNAIAGAVICCSGLAIKFLGL